jgi:hypothetical protein
MLPNLSKMTNDEARMTNEDMVFDIRHSGFVIF